jgi:glycosyltransferase involved in cell wall biosynthesis
MNNFTRYLKYVITRKPRINIVVDVKGWAWWNKAIQLKKWLSDDFDIEIVFDGNSNCDLFFSFECKCPDKINTKYISGFCSHYDSLEYEYKRFKSTVNANAIHANNLRLFEKYSCLNQNCYYTPNGVDEEQFYFKKRDITKPFTVGYVGKPVKKKGLKDIIIPACKRTGVELKIQASRYKSINKIDHSCMPDFYHDIDCVIIASVNEGTPNQLLEAASCGRAFIGNDIGNIPEFYNGKNGLIVKKRDIDSYVDVIKTFKNNKELCCGMGIEARKEIEKGWTWKIQAENYRKMFWEVLKNGYR